jgi:hypothetical protein
VKTPLLLTLAATLCLALSSCVPTSESPLSPAESAQPDSKLIGDWLDKKDQETYHITTKGGPWMHVDVLKDGANTESYDFYPTAIGKNTFANVVVTKPDGHISSHKAYTFIRYSLSENRVLKMWSMSSEFIFGAVKSGKLQGSTLSQDKDPDVVLSDSSDNLVKFIKSADLDKLFTNETVLTKISPR